MANLLYIVDCWGGKNGIVIVDCAPNDNWVLRKQKSLRQRREPKFRFSELVSPI